MCFCAVPWTTEEDEKIVRAQKAMGNKWVRIALLLPGRTDSEVRHRWNSKLMHLVLHGQMATRSGELSTPADPAAPACHKDLGGAAHDPEKVTELRDWRSSEQGHNPALSSDSGRQGRDLEKDTELRGSVARVLPQPASACEDAVGRVRSQHSPATAIHPASAASVQEQDHSREDGVPDRNLQHPFPHLSVCVFVCA